MAEIKWADGFTCSKCSHTKYAFEEPREYVITDFEGNIVYRYRSKQTRLKLDLSPIKRNGVYVLNIRHGNLGTDQYRLIIDR